MIDGQQLPVNQREQDVGREEEQQLPVDELVERSLPLEQEAGETASSGARHISLVRDGHGLTTALGQQCLPMGGRRPDRQLSTSSLGY